MSLRALLGKEVRWGRRRLVALVLVLVVLPGLFASTALLFQEVIPRDAPVALVAGDDDPSAEDLDVARKTFRLFAHPVDYDSRERAFAALDNERVYAVVVVPAGLSEEGASVTIDMYVDNRVVPYREPSQAIASIAGRVLDDRLDADVSVEHHARGEPIRLSAFLLPTFLLAVLWTVALVYLPYTVAAEADAIDRVRVDASLGAYVAAKLGAFTALAAVPVGAFAATAAYLDLEAAVLAPGAVAVALASFLALAAVALAVTLLTRFSTTGRLVNVLVLFAVLTASGLAYPAGFFSPLRRDIVRLFPTHYVVVLVRNAALKGLGPATYPEAVAVVGAFVVGSLALAGGAVRYYRRVAP